MIVDTHTHLLGTGHWPNEWWDWVARDWANHKPGRKPSDIRDRIEAGLVDQDGTRMVQRMDEADVDLSVLLPIDWGPDFTTPTPITAVVDAMFDIADAHPRRLVPFGGIDPRRPQAAELVTEWFGRGARGLKLYPSCGWDPTSDAATEIYAICEANRRPVLFHTGHPLPLLDAKRSNPLLLAEIARSFPGMPIWVGHAGAPVWWDEALELAEAGPNVRLEMSVWLWDDSDHDAEIAFTRKILEAGTAVGFDRIIYGTDHVSGSKVRGDEFLRCVTDMFRRLPQHAQALGATIDADSLAAIMGGTAMRDLEAAGHRMV
ncbi:amidohydrolase family protein [Mycobacterium sp. CBMA293]|uniref:amidohydrolase family protein n=1 Tax=unclassified Mycolicibacterium TaxID=2636767 RepID=UPI0012DF2BBB|nr:MULTISPECIES: amidohydrolase family protein [unclassified Mycolicibacterium]MUL49885.1 amidohydrolase family protein [Mycolicibacterium sp. CBMA 360]MUL62704.1 amidohydrolase family protein [Mycolicibacterium sp. CBMA 335]MUL70748.1 amidohydrolase family protein [Mycolicibacterium sp. CBMA 311]MUL97228.1 amidohydrolase family protein [Mycolicibacterium sp. CBMA 230]MUM07977.1 hypothetical protein [Mycolicibacterium sp. CBMA 213]